MKRKIICLAICVACLMTMLASCGSKPNACTTHVDADKNTVCDGCGLPVITITEKVPTEENIVDMIVAAIPDGATVGDVYNTTTEKNTLPSEFVANENIKLDQAKMLSSRFMAYYYLTQTKGTETTKENWPTLEEWTGSDPYDANGYTKDDMYTVTYAIYDLVDNKDIVSFTTAEATLDSDHVDTVEDIELDEDTGLFIKISTRTWTHDEEADEWSSKLTDAYYFKNGTLFSDEAKIAKGDAFFAPEYVETVNDIAYYVVKDTMYAFDTETCATLTSGNVNTFVKRPIFTYETDAYGIVNMGNKYYVYDLSKWIECVYSYEAPSNAQVFILNNGNLLVQESVMLPDSTLNFDYTQGGKYDLVHTVIDIAAKTATNLEFGYYIGDVEIIDESYTNMADGVKNRVYANAITAKNIAKPLILICDDALTIIAEENKILPEFVSQLSLVADGVFLGTVRYGEGSTVRKLYNAKGEELATLPNMAQLYSTYIFNDGKYYDFTMKLILDPKANEEDPFAVISYYNDYVLLSKGNDYYYWNASLEAPVMIVDATNVEMVPSTDDPEVMVPTTPNPLKIQVLEEYAGDYFIVKTTTTTTTTVEGSDPEVEVVTEYVLYNTANAAVFKSEKAIHINHEEIEGKLVWVINTNGTIYLAK